MNCLLKSTKAKQKSNAAKIKFGVKITCDHKEAMDFDADNRKIKCKDDEILEVKQIYNIDLFESIGAFNNACIPHGSTKIQVHLIYDYKKYGGYKAHMLASSNITGPNIET